MTIKPDSLAILGGLGLAALLALYVAKKGVAGAAAGVVTAAADAAAGTVQGIGQVFGVPMTNADLCAKAKAEGDLWGQSLYCPAGDFLGSAGGRVADVVDTAVSAPVLGAGDVLGIPRTNETECERAKREGRTLDASFSCGAGDFLRYVFN